MSIPLPPPLSLVDLKRELAARGIHLTRKRGQNFCVDINAARAVVVDSGAAAGEAVLEVGPGAGHLTHHLLAAGCRVLAVEIDLRRAITIATEFAKDFGLTAVVVHETDGVTEEVPMAAPVFALNVAVR